MASEHTVEIFVDENGAIELVHDDEAIAALDAAIPVRRTCRASHVEPYGKQWSVDVAPFLEIKQPLYIGFFDTRAEALAAEKAWVLKHLASS